MIFIFNCGGDGIPHKTNGGCVILRQNETFVILFLANSCDNLKTNRTEAWWCPYGRNLLARETTNNALLLSEWWNRAQQDCEGYFKSSDCWAITAHVSVQVMYGDPRPRLKETYDTRWSEPHQHSPNNTRMKHYTDARLTETMGKQGRKKTRKSKQNKWSKRKEPNWKT